MIDKMIARCFLCKKSLKLSFFPPFLLVNKVSKPLQTAPVRFTRPCNQLDQLIDRIRLSFNYENSVIT